MERDETTGADVLPARAPSPGLAAVLAFFVPGLGHVYAGRLGAGVVWFLLTGAAYWLVLVPGFLFHAFSIWSAYRSARDFQAF